MRICSKIRQLKVIGLVVDPLPWVFLNSLLGDLSKNPRRDFTLASIPSSFGKRSFTFRDALQGFLLHDDLPFASMLDHDWIHEVFRKHKSLFGGIYHTTIVLWAFLSQVLRDGKEASCQSAVSRISAFLIRAGRKPPTADTGDYCRARAKLAELAIKEVCIGVGTQAQSKANPKWLWKNRNPYLVDGFTFQMPDTPENQKAYPQHTAQKPGLGFPIARVTGLISLATGALVNAAFGRYKGKGTGETALFKQLFGSLKAGDIVVADRHYCSYWLICALMSIGVDICFRKHQARHTDFRKGRRLGKYDHVVSWKKSVRPEWMSKKEYASLPREITLREIRYVIDEPGRKQEPFVVATTMLELEGETGATRDELADLYGFRWNIELDIRSIKSFMNLSHVRCKSPEMVHREVWVTLLAYNLIRTTIALAANLCGKRPRQISFVSACQYVLASWQEAHQIEKRVLLAHYCRAMLMAIGQCIVGNRPGRFEPRVVKLRRDQYKKMMKPRNELRKRLERHDNSFE